MNDQQLRETLTYAFELLREHQKQLMDLQNRMTALLQYLHEQSPGGPFDVAAKAKEIEASERLGYGASHLERLDALIEGFRNRT
jgi:hypothetical protein